MTTPKVQKKYFCTKCEKEICFQAELTEVTCSGCGIVWVLYATRKKPTLETDQE